MAEDNRTLDTIYENWKLYQDHLEEAIAPLTDEQLALRAALNLRSIGENAAHIIWGRLVWLTRFLGEGDDELKSMTSWDALGLPTRTAAELVAGLDRSWKLMADCLARWSSEDMQQTFVWERDGKTKELSRSWVIWHLLEHDLLHSGEISLTLGMHGLQAPDI